MIEKITSIFEKLKNIDDTFFYGIKYEDSDLPIYNKIYEPFAEALAITLYHYDKKINVQKNKINEFKKKIWNENYNLKNDKYSCFFSSTTSPQNIKKRVNILLEEIK